MTRLATLLTLRPAQCIVLILIALALTFSSASAQTTEPLPVVHVVIFTNPVCTFCRQVVEKDLPPVIQKFGGQLEILYVDVNTAEGEKLYEASLKAFNIRHGVPLLFIGQNTLGGVNIAPQLPALVEAHLAQGGVGFPEIPGLDDYIALAQDANVRVPSPSEIILTPISQNTDQHIVRAVMFWMDGCPHCEEVIQNVLPPLHEKYGEQFELSMIEVATTQDIEILYQVAVTYNVPKEETGVPFLVIGEHALIGSQRIPDELPSLIEKYLAQGGVDLPSNPILADLLPQTFPVSSPTSELPAVTKTPVLADTVPAEQTTVQDNGFTLAIVIMVGMGLVLLYSVITFTTGKALHLPVWTDGLIPAIIVIGIGVAAYLSYVETQSVEAICGPVGDCNTVQQSRYARLFDILPIGILGLLGYVALLASWLARRFIPKLEKPAAIGFFGMTFFAVVFSLYLTYLEPFVIRAVCIWCLTSAVIVTFLLFLGTSPAILQFSTSDEDD